MTHPACRLGPLLVTTTRQPEGAPRVDAARATDGHGNAYGALAFGRGPRALVIGWRGTVLPPPARLVLAAPRMLRPAARWLFAPRPYQATMTYQDGNVSAEEAGRRIADELRRATRPRRDPGRC